MAYFSLALPVWSRVLTPTPESAKQSMRYHQAQEAGLPEAEIERLRLEAEHLFATIGEYQLAALGYQPLTRH